MKWSHTTAAEFGREREGDRKKERKKERKESNSVIQYSNEWIWSKHHPPVRQKPGMRRKDEKQERSKVKEANEWLQYTTCRVLCYMMMKTVRLETAALRLPCSSTQASLKSYFSVLLLQDSQFTWLGINSMSMSFYHYYSMECMATPKNVINKIVIL